ncbi:hypothetical protein Q8F55_009085 [Vanrija albida]|uniref:RING-type domain-containing protein n=1 Tax=Vanrija albida TaxID=181172 RepID=A0ABR3PTK6_9TREE
MITRWRTDGNLIIIVGLSKPVLIDLASTASNCSEVSHKAPSEPVHPVPPSTPPNTPVRRLFRPTTPLTPTKVRHSGVSLAPSPPIPPTFVEYGAPIPELDITELDDDSLSTGDVAPVLGLSRSEGVAIAESSVIMADSDSETKPSSSDVDRKLTTEADFFSPEESTGACDACDAKGTRMYQVLPCGDSACPQCFSSTLAAVSVSRGPSKCPACMAHVASFQLYSSQEHVSCSPKARKRRVFETPESSSSSDDKSVPGETIVMRIDNIAWDIEPDIFIEVASQAAAKRILQTRQNTPMPGGRTTGGRTRAVTISQVTHHELLCELRPGSKAELIWLLELCEAALSTEPSPRTPVSGRPRHQAAVSAGKRVHYIKYRQSPFHALMSIMCKLRGPESPAYWDVFRAIALLATSLKNGVGPDDGPDRQADSKLLTHMSSLFDACFGRRIAPSPDDTASA